MTRAQGQPAPRLDPLFESILGAEDRDHCPFAGEVISYAEHDPAAFLRSIETAAVRAVTLERRGAYHGEWAVLDPERLPPRLRRDDAELDDARYEARLADRWHACRPVVLPGILRPLLGSCEDVLGERAGLCERLGEIGGLRAFLADHEGRLGESFRVLSRRATLHDRERDVERVWLQSFAPNGRGKHIEDLWLKSAWLSTNDDDASLRLRFSFGSEREDDASRDVVRQRVVADLTERLLPETALVTDHPALVPLIETFCAERVLFTQGIAYWNARSGGALFHHDAFAEDALDEGTWRQFGVCYAQLTGSTAWLALSLTDLVARCREFVDALADGELSWVRSQLCEGPRASFAGGFAELRALVGDPARAALELALPGQGRLGPLVGRGPEFTSFLADAGHAYVLDAGDVILLPNRGLAETCMHSVFCASEETGYSLSLALRPDREAPELLEGRGGTASSRRARAREMRREE